MFQRPYYRFLQFLCRLLVALLFRFRGAGQRHLPAEGGALLLSSHQSYLDPVLLGVTHHRPFHYLARETLFRFAPLAWLIGSLNGIPIDREGSGMSGLKETLRRLRRGEIVVLFPEGTRTPDGCVQPLKPGFVALARRAGVPLIPAAIVGAHECWPRRSRFPRPGRICVELGAPLRPQDFGAYEDRDLVAEIHRRICLCHARAVARRGRRSEPSPTAPPRLA
jgi:1-acyl-sn-glycerol-3-phosphate acyltransferase